MKEQKKKYERPKITLHVINHEECIAASSATVTTGSSSNNSLPVVTDWETEIKDGGSISF